MPFINKKARTNDKVSDFLTVFFLGTIRILLIKSEEIDIN